MAATTGGVLTFALVGGREELKDKIWNISPKDTPFYNKCGKEKVSQTFVEWMTDTLADVDTSNAQLEGDDVTPDTSTQPTRLNNSTQILRKSLAVSGTTEVTNKAGRASEYARQLTKKNLELKRDIEAALTSNQTPVPAAHPSNPSGGSADSTTARVLRPYCGWITTNDVRGSGGSDGNATTAATDAGTQRAFTEDLLITALQNAWTSGGQPSDLLMGAFNKRAFSGFSGLSTRMDKSEDKKVVATVDVYESDFGPVRAHLSRFSRARDVLVVDFDYWAVGTLRPTKVVDLAKIGDSERGFMITELTLIARNEASSSIIADLTTS